MNLSDQMAREMLSRIKANPAIADIPWAQSAIDALESGDEKQRDTVANNLLETFGMKRKDVLSQASSIRLPF